MTKLAPLLGLLLAILAGCAAPAPVRRPAEFPRHTPSDFVTLHWQLDRGDGAVTVTGVLVPLGPAACLASVTLELLGTDGAGRVVSRGVSVAQSAAFDTATPWPFTIRLRPTGQEREFTPRVRDVTRRDERSSRGC